MRHFVLPFALSVPLAAPLLWYHLDGMDPLDITVQLPSQEEIDFAETRERLSVPGTQAHGPPQQGADQDKEASDSDLLVQTIVSPSLGY